ncbi:Bud site selection protein bud4 [Lithohypha guttulata]|uniref:Bud site selection protein bud4 n=1 Tax=Lithohypha guttulata TaxID=1690604 RepID=UPI002DDFF8FF|nr:Bud site selection protein bud4 [Lithohypha guttulata]
MAAQSVVSPLRVQKGSNNSSPTKNMSFVQNRPLSELSPMALRRNSPSFPRNSLSKHESSPSTSSPYNNTTSPRMLFWQGRDPNSPSSENRSPHDNISPNKRSSIENLKRASRVKNSSMFAREQQINYDPSDPKILDGKPLRTSIQGNAFPGGALFSVSITSNTSNGTPSTRPEAPLSIDGKSPTKSITPPEKLESSPLNHIAPLSPSKTLGSPTKSSLSKRTGANARKHAFDPSTGIWEDEDDGEEKRLPEGRGLHRHAKSVTFDQAPPQINEYEMTTPDPSSVASGSREGSYESFDDDEEEDYSYERSSSFDPHDDSFDASLEDTEKTPVVLPEDWRFMSPETANTDLVRHQEDVFDDHVGSPAPEARPGSTPARPHQSSAQSVDSNGQARPLPPLPPQMTADAGRVSSHPDSLSGTFERMSGSHRALPSPPPAAVVTVAEIRQMSNSTLSLEDRLKIMALGDTTPQNSDADVQRERKMRRAVSKESSPIRDQYKEGELDGQVHDTIENSSAEKPVNRRLSRDFITQQLRMQDDISRSNSVYSNVTMDPDVPIPSREDPTQKFEDEYEDDSIVIKDEPVDDDDLYKIPDMYRKTSSQLDAEDEESSQYSQSSIQHSVELNAETPRARSPQNVPDTAIPAERVSLPDFADFGQERDLDFGLGQYIVRKTEEPTKHKELALPVSDIPEPDLPDLAVLRQEIARPFTPDPELEPPRPSFAQEEMSEPGTPSSVIRHPIDRSTTPEMDENDTSSLTKTDSDTGSLPSVVVDEPMTELNKVASPPSPGAGDDFTQVQPQSAHHPQPERKRSGNRVSSLVQLDFTRDDSNGDLGLGLEKEFDRVLESQKVAFETSLKTLYYPFNGRFPSAELPDAKERGTRHLAPIPLLPKPSSTRAHFPQLHSTDGFVPKQRGYLMRQNTKIVVATERMSVEEPRSPTTSEAQIGLSSPSAPANEVVISPRKISQPAWVAEPWNNKSRRRSIRVNGEQQSPKRKPVEGPVPPLPGQPSNVGHDLGAVAEDELAEEEAEEFEDGAERGRLFVKVVGVKDLQLPFPQRKPTRALGQIAADHREEEKTQFALTLDNGLHCVTTSWLDLARSAPIGQEFELVVLNDLEFQLTLQMKLDEPPKPVLRPESPTKAPVSPKKQSAFGRFFGSPKKKKDSEIFPPEPQPAKRPVTPPSAYELVQGIVAKDGSFARAYVSLSEYEKQAFGRPATVDIKCFNEWAMEEVAVGSSRSKKGVVKLQQRPPYEIGKLELQLLYVPKPKGAKDEDMPKSMNGAIRAMREAEEQLKQQSEIREFEGYLSQQGGDCPYWRRRFFKLVGTRLTAYHETTLQPRATINLAKAAKLIDDKAVLAQKEVSTRKGGRRKSALSEDEHGALLPLAFRLRFNNGEVIDFYADNATTKDDWMAALSEAVGKQVVQPSGGPINGWTDMVLKREKSTKAKSKPSKPEAPQRKSSKDKDLPARPAVDTRHSYQGAMMAGALQNSTSTRPPSSLPRPSGHARTESYHADAGASRSQASSPTKQERHRKTMSMWS